MNRSLILLIASLFCLPICNAQNNRASNALSFELGKTGLMYNVSFDHQFRNKKFGLRATVGFNLARRLNATATGGGGYFLFGKKNAYFELGADLAYLEVNQTSDDQRGFELFYPNYSIKSWYASMNLGFRKYGKRGLFRMGFSPGFIKTGFLNGAYISYGVLL